MAVAPVALLLTVIVTSSSVAADAGDAESATVPTVRTDSAAVAANARKVFLTFLHGPTVGASVAMRT